MRKFTRAEFFQIFTPLLILLGSGKWLAACSDDKTDTTDGDNGGGGGGGGTLEPDCLNAGTTVSIGTNHGHSLVVPKQDVAAGVEEIYNITGSAGHVHTVTLTPTHFASLAANQQIVVTSSPADGVGHTHNVTVSCALA